MGNETNDENETSTSQTQGDVNSTASTNGTESPSENQVINVNATEPRPDFEGIVANLTIELEEIQSELELALTEK